MDKQANTVNKSQQITPEMERRMRLLANLIIDRIFEDKKNEVMKFKPDSSKRLKDSKKHVNQS